VDRTIVVITADHGEMLGDHGLLFKARYMYDEVLRTPLIIRAPGKLPAGRRISAMTEGIDIMPTLLDLLGIQPSVRVQGTSLLPLVHGKANGREEIHSEFPGTKVVRTADWKLVHYLREPYGELYNLREDPHELHNLYDDPAYASARAEMKSRLADWLIESEDPALPPAAENQLSRTADAIQRSRNVLDFSPVPRRGPSDSPQERTCAIPKCTRSQRVAGIFEVAHSRRSKIPA
jgi:arylsulfatase A-like enzyme